MAAHDVAQFWETIPSQQSGRLILNPGDFYLLASREMFRIPPSFAAEMEQFDPSMGEFSIHYAGFFDPGFGYGIDGEIEETRGVLEVRAHEFPILLRTRTDGGPPCVSQNGERPRQAVWAVYRVLVPATGLGAAKTI